jgi:hypothetical protein
MLLALCLFGCATIDSLQPGRGGSTFEIHGKTYDEVWNAAVRTASRSLTIVESDKASGTLKAEKGVGMATWGEVVGIHPPNDKPSCNLCCRGAKSKTLASADYRSKLDIDHDYRNHG